MLLFYIKVHPLDSKGKKQEDYFYNFTWNQFDKFDNEFVKKLKERDIFEYDTEVNEFKKRYNLKDAENASKENNRDFNTLLLNYVSLFNEKVSVIVNIPFCNQVVKERVPEKFKRIYDPYNEKFIKIDSSKYNELELHKFKIGDVLFKTKGKFHKLYTIKETLLDEVSARKVHNLVTEISPRVFIDNNVEQFPVFKLI